MQLIKKLFLVCDAETWFFRSLRIKRLWLKYIMFFTAAEFNIGVYKYIILSKCGDMRMREKYINAAQSDSHPSICAFGAPQNHMEPHDFSQKVIICMHEGLFFLFHTRGDDCFRWEKLQSTHTKRRVTNELTRLMWFMDAYAECFDCSEATHQFSFWVNIKIMIGCRGFYKLGKSRNSITKHHNLWKISLLPYKHSNMASQRAWYTFWV